jgi:hypothetical protein
MPWMEVWGLGPPEAEKILACKGEITMSMSFTVSSVIILLSIKQYL